MNTPDPNGSDPYHADLIGWKVLPDGREIHVWPITYGRARLGITDGPGAMDYRDVW